MDTVFRLLRSFVLLLCFLLCFLLFQLGANCPQLWAQPWDSGNKANVAYDVTFSGTTTFTGSVSFSGTVTFTGTSALWAADGDTVRIDPGTAKNIFEIETNNVTNFMVDTTQNGRVGIGGTSSPARSLHLYDRPGITFEEISSNAIIESNGGINFALGTLSGNIKARFNSDGSFIANGYNFAADAEASDAYVITLETVPVAYVIGQIFTFTANTANTGAATLNVNSLGAKTIKKLHDQDLITGDIEAGQAIVVLYDGTNMQMISQLAQ